MEKRVLKHPRKVVKIMEEFVESASDLTYIFSNFTFSKESVDDYEGDDWVHEALKGIQSEEEEYPRSCKMTHKKNRGFAACVSDLEDMYEEFFRINYNFKELMCKEHKCFREDFEKRCPMGRGFADVTLALLHELGHFETHCEELALKEAGYDREAEIEELRKEYNNTYDLNIYGYFRLPDETMATDWAIEWLQSAENRKIAKAFEKKFFACFE